MARSKGTRRPLREKDFEKNRLKTNNNTFGLKRRWRDCRVLKRPIILRRGARKINVYGCFGRAIYVLPYHKYVNSDGTRCVGRVARTRLAWLSAANRGPEPINLCILLYFFAPGERAARASRTVIIQPKNNVKKSCHIRGGTYSILILRSILMVSGYLFKYEAVSTSNGGGGVAFVFRFFFSATGIWRSFLYFPGGAFFFAYIQSDTHLGPTTTSFTR